MNSEESRLRTFAKWPENAVVDAKRVAKAGFYYTGLGLDVQCFCCGGRISEWNYGDKVMARHRALDPRCPFVLNPSRSGNIPSNCSVSNCASIRNERNSRSTGTDSPFSEESSRLASFTTWPSANVSYVRLAQSGFFYTKVQDKVRCAFCHGIIGNWKPTDNPDLEHQKFFPHCPFIKDRAGRGLVLNGVNVRESETVCMNNEMDTLLGLGVQSHRVPKSPWFSTYISRFRTYVNWPTHLPQKPEELAEAGFFFTGVADEVRCFHCDGGLRFWQKNDLPWIEHARWFGECGFVLLVKGSEFVEESLLSFPPTLTTAEKVSLTIPRDNSRIHDVSEVQLQSLMNSPAAIAALQIGMEASRVKSALKQKLETTGLPYQDGDANDLIVSCLEIQSEEGTSAEEEQWSTPPGSPVYRRILPPLAETAPPEDSEEENSVTTETTEPELNEDLEEDEKPVESPQPLPNSNLSLEEENRRLKEARLCKICMDNEVGVVFLPCGHLVTCVNCAQNLDDCPLCRQQIKATVRTFLS